MPILPSVEFIDVDALPDRPDVQVEETVKNEEVAVKQEPGLTFTNTVDDPIILDDEDEPPPSVDMSGNSLMANRADTLIISNTQEEGPSSAEPSSAEPDDPPAIASPDDPIVLDCEDEQLPRMELGGSSLTARPRVNLGSYKEGLRSIQQHWARAKTFNHGQAESSAALDAMDTDIGYNPADAPDLSDPESSDDEERLQFIEARNLYEEMKNTGQATAEDDIRFVRLRRQEQIRLRKRKEDRVPLVRGELEDSLFVQQDEEVGQSTNAFLGDDFNDEFQDDRMEEYDQENVDHEETLCSAKAKRKAQHSTAKSNDKKKREPKSQKPPVQDKNARVRKSGPAKGETKRRKQKQPAKPKLTDIGSLLTGNILHDHASNQGKTALPQLTSNRRNEALNNLIASLPEEERKAAKSDKKYLDEACKVFKRGTLRVSKESEGDVPTFLKLKGLRCDLKPHQVMGAGWMRKRELDDDNSKGGLCADQMGLGKTIMMLANIIDGKHYEQKNGPKTTLIVATPALVEQWYEEIRSKVEFPLRVLRHIVGKKLSSNDDINTMKEFDIVLTTYTEVMKSYPRQEPPLDLQTAEEKSAWWKEFYEENRGDLHRIVWHRIVLDEAQAIKNHASATSNAARALMGEHRWALSGTPIQNSLNELYPYFKFVNVPFTGSFKIFCRNYIGSSKNPTSQGIARLNALLAKYMLRRTHKDQMFGHPILKLPDARQDIHWIRFNAVEQSIYDVVRTRMIQKINLISREHGLEKQYHNILVMLLRLRQLTDHILMIHDTMRRYLEREDYEKILEITEQEAEETTDKMRAEQLRETRKVLALHPPCPTSLPKPKPAPGIHVVDDEDRPPQSRESEAREYARKFTNSIGRHYGQKFDFVPFLRKLCQGQKWEEVQERTRCELCAENPENPFVTSCFHIYCHCCLITLQTSAAEADVGKARCVKCHTIFQGARECDRIMMQEAMDEMSGHEWVDDSDFEEQDFPRYNRNGRGRKREKKKRDWIDLAGEHILPSSKTIAAKAQILNWIEEDPSVKIIIYTQYIDMIRVFTKICKAERWEYKTYYGSKSHDARAKAIKAFGNEPNVRILIASLKAGGIGLNLTMASRVIILDPWWNDCVEQQAFGRVYRFGQTQESAMTRFVVAGTVDQNMIEMQIRKREAIDMVIDSEAEPLSTSELLGLFGDTAEDEQGNTFILVENRDRNINPLEDRSEEMLYDEP